MASVWELSPAAEAALVSRAAALVTAADAEAPVPTDALEAATTLLQQDQVCPAPCVRLCIDAR